MPRIAELRDRGSRIGQQALLVGGIDPGPCYHPRAVARADLVLVGIDQRIERRRIDQPFFDQQRFERLDSQGKVRRNRLVSVIVAMVLRAGDVARRRRPASRQGTASSRVHPILLPPVSP